MTGEGEDLVEYALAFYAADGVAERLLSWQERFGADVDVLIYTTWLGVAKSASVTEATIGAADAAIAGWRRAVILPLRGVRRTLKGFQGEGGEAAAAIRESVKRIEIEAELIALRKLAALPPADGRTNGGQPISDNLRCAFRFYSGAEATADEEEALQHLTKAAGSVGTGVRSGL